MSFHLPSTVEGMASATRACHQWRAQRFGLMADWVAVLSAAGLRGTLDPNHALSDHVMIGAERYRDDYMTTGSRVAHPSVTVYFVRDLRSRRVVLALQADGSVLDELDTIRPDLRPTTRAALRDAFRIAADNAALMSRQGL